MAQLFTPPFQTTLDANANVVPGARLTFYLSETTTPATVYADAALTTPLSSPVIADSAGRFVPIYLDPSLKYRVIVADAAGTTIRDVDPISDSIIADLADGEGLDLVGFIAAGPGAVPRTALSKAREWVSVLDYGAVGDGEADDTEAFKDCRNFCEETGATMRIPAGGYKLTDTIVVGGSFDIVGEGGSVSRILPVFNTQKPVFDLAPGDNQVVNGMRFSGIGMFGLDSPVAPDFITIRSALVNSTIRQSMFTDLFFQHVRRGISLSGVIYRCTFENITGTDISDIGIYSDLGFIDVTYNTFQQIEMTNVLDGAWAYYIRSSYSTFDTMTSDGVAYFSSPAGVMRNYTTETVQANSFPAAAGNNVVTLNQMQLVDNFTIRGVDPAKRSVALRVIGTSVITAMRMVGPHPINAVFLDSGSSGVINTLQVSDAIAMIEDTHSDATLNLWTFNNCFQVTKRSMRYGEGQWTPTFTGWSTAPTVNVNGTTYERVGNRIFATLLANGGVAASVPQIGGLPFPSSDVSVGVATFSTTDPTKRIANGSLGPDSSVVGSMGAIDMTGTDWAMIVEYRA